MSCLLSGVSLFESILGLDIANHSRLILVPLTLNRTANEIPSIMSLLLHRVNLWEIFVDNFVENKARDCVTKKS